MKLEDIIKALTNPNGSQLSADGIEGLVLEDGQELLRQVIQAAIDARSASETREESVTGADGVVRNHVRSRTRSLMTTVGPVDVERLAYSARGSDSVMPLDEQLELPEHLYSFKVRRRIAEYAAEMSFGKARRFSDSMGLPIPQRQTEELAARPLPSEPPTKRCWTDATTSPCSGTFASLPRPGAEASARRSSRGRWTGRALASVPS